MTITMHELSEYLAINQHVLRAWVKKKRIPYVKSGKKLSFDLKIIDEWIENSRYKVYKADLFKR